MPIEKKAREKVPVLVKRREIAIEENKQEKQIEKAPVIPHRWRVR